MNQSKQPTVKDLIDLYINEVDSVIELQEKLIKRVGDTSIGCWFNPCDHEYFEMKLKEKNMPKTKETALTHLVQIYIEFKNVSIGQRSNSPMGRVQDMLADFLDTYPDDLRKIPRKEYKEDTT